MTEAADIRLERSLFRSAWCVKKASLYLGVAFLLVLLSVSCYLLVTEEWVAIQALWFVVAIFGPIVVVAKMVDSSLLQVLVGISFLTQLVSVPVFVITRDTYSFAGWRAVKDFTFTFPELARVYSLCGFFLLSVVCVVAVLVKIRRLPALPKSGETGWRPRLRRPARKSGLYLILLLVVVAAMIPLNFWTFSKGISLTGVEPPRLPFRLSGILHYFTSYVMSLVLAVIYARTSRSYLPAVILMTYAVLLGASHISKGTLFYAIAPVIYCAVLDRRYFLFGLSGVVCLAGIQVITLLRGLVYVAVGTKVGSDTATGLIRMLGNAFGSGVDYSAATLIFAEMVNRVEAAQEIILASKFNVDVIGGFGKALLGFNYKGWNVYDTDAYHLEFKGIVLPEGLGFGAGGLLAKALLLTHSELFYIFLFAVNVSLYVLLGELIARSIGNRFANKAYYHVAGGLFIFIFYTDPGSRVFLGITAFLLLVGCINFSGLGRLLKPRLRADQP